MKIKITLLVLFVLLALGASAQSWPIKASANKRYLVDQNGTPFLMVIDAAHHLMQALPQASVSTYLTDRATNQFNTVDVYAICTGGSCGSTMAAQDGTLPFTTGTSPSNFDVSTANPTYWAEVDNVVTTAKNNGLTVILFACPWGNGCSTLLTNGVNTSAKIFAYGQFLGNRYKTFTNIVWAMGDDLDQTVLPSSTNLALVTHLAAGIQSNDPNHLITYQFNFNESYAQQAKNVCSNPSTCFTEFNSTLTLSNTYDYFELYDYSIQEWLATPTLPAILSEANYETANNTGSLSCTAGGGVLCPQGSNTDAFITREQMWWPVTSGTFGFEFGNSHVSHFDSGGVWNANLDTTATLQVKYVNQLMSRLPWWTLSPECTVNCATSTNHALVSAGYGTYNGSNLNLYNGTYASGAFDGSKYAVIYAPVATTLTLKMTAFSGTTDVNWYDPTTGTFTSIAGSPFANSGTRTFTTPVTAHSDGTGRKDWVLVAAPSSCPATVPAGVVNCFFTAANGSDSNDGRSEVTPWLYSPGMNSCSGACLTEYNVIKGGSGAGAAGVGLIFRGGDSWHFGNASAVPFAGSVSTCALNGTAAAGLCFNNFQASSGSPFYAGVDNNWFTGTAWSRPILTADNSLCNAGTIGVMPDGATCSVGTDPTGRGQATYVVSSCPYQVGGANVLTDIGFSKNLFVDNFEMVGLCAKTVGQVNGVDIFMNTGGEQGPNHVTNNYIHGDSHLQYAFANSSASCTSSVMCFDMYVFNGNLGAGTVGNTVQNNVIDFSDSDPAGTGLCAPGTTLYNFSYNVVRYNSQCIPKNVDVVHDNLFEFYYENGHSNLWEDATQGPIAAYYNNVFRHMFGALVYWPGPSAPTDSAYFFNNVTHDVTTAQYLDYGGTGVNANTGTYFVFNNTFQSNGSSSTVIACSSTPSVPFKNTNNHFINDVGSFPASGCAGMTNLTPLSMTNAAATSAGYTSAQPSGYSPTSGGSPTVNTGTSEYSGYCSTLSASADPLIQAAGTACRLDTAYGVSYNSANHTVSSPGRAVTARPSSGSWDIGAYQFSSATPTYSISGTVSPAAGSSAPSPLTVTLSGGASATQSTASYSFPSLTAGLNYTVTPSAATYTFAPVSSTFNALAANQTANFTATGTPTATLTPSTWDFGSEGIGLMSAAKLFSYSATGTADLTSVAVSITGTNAGDFIRTDSSCPATIPAGTHCNPTIVFSPVSSSPTNRSATLQVTSNVATQTATLTGTAFQPPTPSCSPAGGSYKSARIVTCSNAIPAATMCWSTTSPPTTNGNGTCTSGTTYIAPFMVSSASTLFVTGTQAGNADQAVSYSFTINPAWTTGWVMNSSTVGATTFGNSRAIQALVQLPQNWVDNLEYVGTTTNTINFPATSTGGSWTCAANSTTYGPYTADTTSSLQTAINNAETCRTIGGLRTTINIPAGHLFSNTIGLVFPQTAGDTSTNFIILQSTTPLTTGRTACSHGIQDNLSTSTQPGIRNVGCNATKMGYQLGTTITPINYALDTLTSTGNQAFTLANGTATNTSAYNDVASMWTAQCTQANCNVISTAVADVNGVSPHHFAILNAELRPAAALVAALAPVKIGLQTETAISQLPSHIHLAYDYIHGDWTDAPVSGGVGTGSPTGANSLPNGVYFAGCNYCSIAYSYLDRMIRPGGEGHAILLEYAQQIKVVHNWIEGQSIGLFSGGVNDTIDIPNFVPATDVEDRGNRYTFPYSWILAAEAGFCPNGLACGPNGYVRKNSHELKVAERYVYDGNINENVDNSGGQNGINLSWKVSNAGGGGQGNYWFLNENVTFTNNIMRASCRGGSWGYRSNFGISTGGGVTLPTQKTNWTNNLTYNISLANPGCSTASPIAGLQVNTNNGGTSWVASCTRDGAGATVSCALTTQAGGTQSDMNVGDPVNVISCTDTTLNTPTTGLTLALPGTLFSGLTVVYPNVGTPNASSGGCQLGYFQGWPRYFTYDHNTEVIDSGANSPFSVGGSTPIELARDLTFSNSVYVHGGPNSTFGEGTRTLTKGFDGTSLKFHHLAFTERDSAVSCPGHNPNPGGIAACYAEWDTKGTQVSPTTIWGTQTASCTGSANSTCLGIVGGLNMGSLPTVLSDYHGYALASGSIFKAGQANQASDGADMGANISAIDAAQVSNQYPGGFPDH